MRPAIRLARLPESFWHGRARALDRLRAQDVDVIRLDVGNPDMPPINPIIEALNEAAHDPSLHGYAGGAGLPAFRQAIAAYYERRFQVSLDPDAEVLPLIGSKEGIAKIALAFLDPGDLALIPEPGYPTYRDGTHLAGGRSYLIALRAHNDYLPDLDAIPDEVADRAKLIWLNYPNNPTGAVAPLDLFTEAVDFAQAHDLLICHDAPYAEVAYEGYRPPSILQVPGAREVAIEFNSLSKTYNMAGWRIAMAVGSAEAVGALRQVKSNMDSGLYAPLQMAAIAALEGDQGWIAERNAIYQTRRDIIVDALEAMGLSPQRPLATLYIWARVPEGRTSAEFAEAVLEKAHVSLVPGYMYGPGGEGYIRLSLTEPTPRVREAMERLRAYLS
jgi:LL-diaminopimelate aminotransferase